ncbi:DUF7470 family protein [Haloarchaeobius sp. HRN-SO-5]|uniref:DUF7470 family protein n=1 Tax=Haloarchaeobius sp. HRN-SO-5 TaxID=3446118 RepID=UPI003EBBA9FF
MAADMTPGAGSSGPGGFVQILGVVGALGVLLVLGGIAMIAIFGSLELAAGFAMVLAGVGLLVKALVSNVLGMLGMGGMF